MNISFESHSTILSSEPLCVLTQKLSESTQDNDIKNIINSMFNLYSESQDPIKSEARIVIIELFTKYNGKKNVKKYLQEKISKLNVVNFAIEGIKDLTAQIENEKKCNMKQFSHVQHFLYIISNLQKSNDYTLNQLLPLYNLILSGYVHQIGLKYPNVASYEELILLINSILKQILSGLAKNDNFKSNVAQNYSFNFIKQCYDILKYDNLGYDIKTKCGLMLVNLLMILPESEVEHFEYNDCPVLDLIKNSNCKIWFTLKNCSFDNIFNENNKVVIYSAVFNAIPSNKLLNIKISDKDLVTILYEELVSCAKRATTNPPQIVEVSRILSMIGKHLKSLPVDKVKGLFILGLQHVWSHVDHFVDTVRQYIKIISADLVALSAFHSKNGHNECLDILLENMHSSSEESAAWFVIIEQIGIYYGCNFLLETYNKLPSKLIKLLGDITLQDNVCKTYSLFLELHYKETDEETFYKIWILPIAKHLKEKSENTVSYQNIITSGFKVCPTIINKIFPPGKNLSVEEHGVLLKCLKLARNARIVIPQEDNRNYWRGLVEKNKLEMYKWHQDDEIRISALALIVDSQKSTELFLEWEFEYLLSYLTYNITSQVPNIRKQLITHYKNALLRYDASYNVILRNLKKVTDNEEYKIIVDYYNNFIKSFAKLLISNLTVDANYSRRSTSLELLSIVEPYLKEHWIHCWRKEDVLNCQNILYDSYESNKKMALSILLKLPPELMGFDDLQVSETYVHNCIKMACDIKPSNTLSAVYMLQLSVISPHFYDIMSRYSVYKRSNLNDVYFLTLTVLSELLLTQSNVEIDVGDLTNSLYGIILSLRYLLERRKINDNNTEYAVLFKDLIDTCFKIKEHIMPIVCNPSPEGYLPENAKIFKTDESAIAQMVLVYAWRTMKEMTLLLAEIVRQSVKLEERTTMVSQDLLISIGQFFIDIFIESKHRGVFEQAYVGFSIVSQAFWESRNQTLSSLPSQWLKNVLDLCTGTKLSNKLCATRRSAGLPFMILSILTTDLSYDKICFHDTIQSLLKCCKNTSSENDEFRMHSLNILRALFRHSKLGEMVSMYVGQTMVVSITGFKSPSWGIRNSSTLLYSALMTRMFGVQRTQDSVDLSMKNRLTVRVFFMRYPELFQFLFKSLSEECDRSDSLILHPILMILARLYPSHIEEYSAQSDAYLPFLSICLANPLYRTRELAARASVPLIPKENLKGIFENCFNSISEQEKDNLCSGKLLQVLYLIKSNSIPMDLNIAKCINDSLKIFENTGTIHSHLTLLLYVEVITFMIIRFKQFRDDVLFKKLVSLITNYHLESSCPITVQSPLIQAEMGLLTVLLLDKLDDKSYDILKLNLNHYLNGKDNKMKCYALNFLIYANMKFYNHIPPHPILETEEIEIPENVTSIINALERKNIGLLLRSCHDCILNFYKQQAWMFKFKNNYTDILLFLLLCFYPCILKNLNQDTQKTLDLFVDICKDADKDLASVVISCVTTLLSSINDKDLAELSFKGLIAVLMELASPAAPDYGRLVVGNFFAKMNTLILDKEAPILQGADLINVLNICMILLEDDDADVRNSLSTLFVRTAFGSKISTHSNLVIPERIKESLLNTCTKILPKREAINFLFSWSCRHFPDHSNDVSAIFERGELNLFAENIFTANISSQLLINLLYDTKQNTSGIQNLKNITDSLLKSLKECEGPMMDNCSRKLIINSLDMILMFHLEDNETDKFKDRFNNYFNNNVLKYLKDNIKNNDYYLIKNILIKIYKIIDL